MPSRRASSTTRSAISLAALALFALAACTPTLKPPTATAEGPGTAHVGVPVLLDGSKSAPGERPDGDLPLPITFRWSFVALPAGSHAALNDATIVKPSFTPDLAGDYVVQLIVADGVFASAASQVTIKAVDDCRPTLTAVTAAPSLPGVGEPVALSYEPGTPCAEAGALATITAWKWTIVSAPAGSAAQIGHPSSPRASFVPDRRGEYEIALELIDAAGLASDPAATSARVKVTAQACGDNVPEVQEIAPVPSKPNVQQAVQLGATVTHADTVAPCSLRRDLQYRWSMNALPAGSRAALNDPGATNPSFTPDVPGDYVVGLVVTDDQGRRSAQKTFVVSTTTCGAAVPVVTAVAPADAFAGQGIQLGVQVTSADNPAADGLNSTGAPADPAATGCSVALAYSYRWSLLAAPRGSKAALNDPGLANPSFVTDTPGDYLLGVVATASTGKTSDRALATIRVSECGSLAPEVTLDVPPGAITGAPLQVKAVVSDPNAACRGAGSFRYAWSLLSAPAGSASLLSGSGSGVSAEQAPSLTPDRAGSYVVSLVVTDAHGLASAPQTATITVGACNAPIDATIEVSAGAITGASVGLSAAIVNPNAPAAAPSTPDPDAGTSDPDAGTIDPDAGTLDPDAGTSDPDAGTSDPDAGTSDPDAGTPDADGGTTTTTACTAAVTPYAYAWALVGLPAGSKAAINNPSASAPSFQADLAGRYTVQLVVTDAAGNRSPAVQASVDVADCTAPLDLEIGPFAGASVGLPYALRATVTNPNEPSTTNRCTRATAPHRYEWRLTGLPTGSHARLNDGNSVAPSFTPDVLGTYTVALRVSDAQGNQSAWTEANVEVGESCAAPLEASIDVSPGPVGLPVVFSAQVTNPNTPDAATNRCTAATAPYSYAWSLVGLPAGSHASLNNAASAAPSIVPDVEGSYTVALTVIDAAGNKSPAITQAFTTTGRCTAPLTASIAEIAGAAAGVPLALSAEITDPNTPDATNGCTAATAPYSYVWSIVGLPTGSTAALNNVASAAPSFTPDLTGTYQVSLRVSDAAGNQSPTVTRDITVSASCRAPLSASVVSPAGAAVGVPFGWTANVEDPNTPAPGNACTAPTAPYSYVWSIIGLPTGSHASLNNASSSAPTLVPDVTGTYVVSLRVTDAAGHQSPAVTGSVEVSGNCRAALTATIAAPTGTAAGVPFAFSAAVTDPNTPDATNGCVAATSPYAYSWSLVGLPVGSRASLSGADAAAPSLTPDLVGVYSVSLRVTDAAGNMSRTATASVNVTGDCRASPTATINAPSGVAVGVPTPLSATISDPNAPGPTTSCTVATTPFAHAWSLIALPASSRATLFNAASASPTLTPDVAGTYTVALVATDAAGNRSLTATRNVVVSDSCAAPLTVNVSAPVGARTRLPVQLSATVVDPNTPAASNSCVALTTPLTYAWSLVGLPAGSRAVLNNTAAAAPSFTPDVAGTYAVSLLVTNAAGIRSQVLTTNVVASDCSAPLTVSLARSGTASTLQTSTFTATVTNTNGAACGLVTPYTYTWSLAGRPARSSAGLSPNGTTATLVPDEAGSYVVALSVTDALGNTGSASTTTSISGCGGSNNVAVAVRSAVAAPIAGQSVDLAAVVSDTNHVACSQPTSAPFAYAWTLVVPPGSAATLSRSTTAAPAFTPDVAGTYTAVVTVTDALGYSATNSTTLTAVGCTMTLTLSQSAANPVTNFTPVRVSAAVTFPSSCINPPAVSYRWTWDSLPLGSTASFVSSTASSAVFTPDAVGSWVVRATVTDDVTGATAAATQTVTTAACGASAPVARIAVAGAVTAAAATNLVPSTAPVLTTTNLSSVQLDGTASIAPSIGVCLPGPMLYKWSVYAVPPGSTSKLSLETAAKPSFKFEGVGEYILQLIVNDGLFDSPPTYVRFQAN